MNIIPTVGILIYKNDKVLLVKHGVAASHLTGSYGVPAGRFNGRESGKQAAVRELQEETGLITSESELVQLKLQIPPADLPRKDGTTKRFTITLFYCKDYKGKLAANDETIPEWIAVNEIDKLTLIGNTKMIVEEGLLEIKSL